MSEILEIQSLCDDLIAISACLYPKNYRRISATGVVVALNFVNNSPAVWLSFTCHLIGHVVTAALQLLKKSLIACCIFTCCG